MKGRPVSGNPAVQKLYLGLCLVMLAGSVALTVEAIELGLSLWMRLPLIGLFLGLSVQAWQVVRNSKATR
ncbi:hypothetical protein [Deinococcus enclensis]|uniref:Uncharacterized protein n=1 Tax=Deinococcus enclensis TaxID=1049582 RepID=A0ABT9MFS1_9DEIO|nr:hypothetical protein [Deinococcus enclensis]MDP9765437.1 hypothetical protein [Deinococcus enclensis]